MKPETRTIREAFVQIVPNASDKEIDMWLDAPNPAFGAKSPNQMVADGRADSVWQMIYQIEAGVFS